MSTHRPDDSSEFASERRKNAEAQHLDPSLKRLANEFMLASALYRYSYNFDWLGRPIIQLPQDIVAMQELIWRVRPDLVVETGVARGGSAVLYASILKMLGGDGIVAAVDIDIRSHNRDAITSHPLADRIILIEGSSTDAETVRRVFDIAKGRERVIVTLDSNHTHEHVLEELRLYSPLVRSGGYLVVFDTLIDEMPEELFADRPWGVGNNPATAVREFLETCDRFVVDRELESKLLLTVAPGGYLRCTLD